MPREGLRVLDMVYIAVTVLFFGLMLLYTHACERLGRSADHEEPKL